MKNLKRLFATLLTVGIAAFPQCGGNDDDSGGNDDDVVDEFYTLTFTGSGFTPHNGALLGAALVDLATGAVVETEDTVVADGAFQIVWDGILKDGGDYKLYYFADKSSNGECDAPPTDHGWSVAISNVAGDRTVAETHNLNFDPNVCGSF